MADVVLTSPVPCFREIALEQGSPEWLNFRKQHITATEIAHLWAGTETFESLKGQKEGKINPPDLSKNPAVREGKLFEPVIRRAAGMVMARRHPDVFGRYLTDPIPTPVVERLDEPFFMASLDGLFSDGSVLEIKNTYSQKKAGYGDVNDHGINSATGKRLGYFAQVQWEMYCTGATRCVFATHQGIAKDPEGLHVGFNPASLRVSIIERDEKTVQELVTLATAFRDYYVFGVEPVNLAVHGILFGHTTNDPAGLAARLQAYASVESRCKQLEAELKALKEVKSSQVDEICNAFIPENLKKAEGKLPDGRTYALTHSERTGALDMAALTKFLVSKGIKPDEIEQFRKAGTVVNRVSVK